MTQRPVKLGCFVLEALNSFASTLYIFYLPFFTRDEFGFGSRDNLFLIAVHGFTYIFASWQGGRFAQRWGYFNALKLGFLGMALALALGWIAPGIKGQIVAMLGWTFSCCLIWPSIEALVTAGETFQGTARMVGVYNVVWSSTSALAYFAGGWLWDKLGRAGLFGIPIAIMAVQLVLVIVLAHAAKKLPPTPKPESVEPTHQPEAVAFQQKVPPQRFLQMAWLANPFAYVALNTIGAVIPQLARKFELTPTQTGVFCSIWFFVRFFAFILFWKWTGWHYRFRWLLLAFVGLIAGFATLLLAAQLALVIAAQAVIGVCLGLIYYSSLFYAMDAGDAKGEHGGLHEAAIGIGICAGPAVGGLAMTLAPQNPNAGTYAVATLLLIGLGSLIGLRLRRVR